MTAGQRLADIFLSGMPGGRSLRIILAEHIDIAVQNAVAAERERCARIAEGFIPSGFRGNEMLHEGTYHKLPLGDIIGIARDDRARVIAAAIRESIRGES